MRSNRILLVFAIIICFMLTGCQSDEQRAVKIEKIMIEAAQFENEFAVKQKELNETNTNAQLLYNELISLDMNDKDTLNKKIEEGYTYTIKQQELLKETEENYIKAYSTSSTIEKYLKKIKDEKQKNQASKLLKIMNERKKLIDMYFENYHAHLELQVTFYEHLKGENFNLENLDKQIKDINEHNQVMAELVQQFNEYTKQYTKVETDYYQMIS